MEPPRKPMHIGEDQILSTMMTISDNVGRMTAVGVETALKVDKVIDAQNSMNLKFVGFEIHLNQIQNDNKEIKTSLTAHDLDIKIIKGRQDKIWADLYGDNERKDSTGIFQYFEGARGRDFERQGAKKLGAAVWSAIAGGVGILTIVGNFLVRKFFG